MENELERIVRVLEGEGNPDVSPGVMGLLDRQLKFNQKIEGRVTEVERTIDRVRWTVAGAALAGSALGGGMVFLLTRFFEEADASTNSVFRLVEAILAIF